MVAVAAASFLLTGLLVALTAVPAAAASFENPETIYIFSLGWADPYPSTISVSGLPGDITDVDVTLTGYSHASPDDVDVLLVGPSGQTVVLMSDVGGAYEVSGIDLTFDDAAAAFLPDSAQITEGTYRPTQGEACGMCDFNGGAPAPIGPYGTALSEFDGTVANGTWSLFVWDDHLGDTGQISGGWTLEITTEPTISSFAPTKGKVGTSVVITGTEFTVEVPGGIGVVPVVEAASFGGVAVTSFTVDSATQITATVPAGAVTGPIAVTTPDGTATSTDEFVVKHPREVTLNLTRRRARGTVTVTDGFAACASGVTVKVQRRVNSRWRNVGTAITSGAGTYRVGGATASGKYRTLAKKVRLASGDLCPKAKSPVVRK